MFRIPVRPPVVCLAARSLAAYSFLGLLCLASLAPRVRAQDASVADALVDQGVERRRAGDDEGALELFTRAYEQSHRPRALAQMALAEQALGRFVAAESHLVTALESTDDEWISRRREDLQRALEAIQQRLGYLEVRGGVEGADVRIDGRSVGRLPLERPIRIATGSYRLEVVARRYYPATRTIIVVAEATTREAIELLPLPEAPSSTDESHVSATSPRAASNGRRILAISSVAAGGGLLATSAAMFFVRQSRAADYNSDACLASGLTRGENCGDLYDGAIRAQRASAATLALGLSAAAAGTLLFTIGRSDDTSRTAMALGCNPVFGAAWGGLCQLRY